MMGTTLVKMATITDLLRLIIKFRYHQTWLCFDGHCNMLDAKLDQDIRNLN